MGKELVALKYHKKKMSKMRKIFLIVMLAYPVLQFLITWIYVNIGSIMLVFQKYDQDTGLYKWAGLLNIKLFFASFSVSPDVPFTFLNSLLYMPLTCLISIPLATFFSYCLFKKMPLSTLFRVIFFLPNVIPVVALTIAFRLPFDPDTGFMYNILRDLGYNGAFFGAEPNAQIMIYIYCLWAGLGYNIILLSGAIGRIPDAVIESARLDGAGFFREFIQFTVPLIWPTLITLNLMGMTTVLTMYLQPFLLTKGRFHTSTIAMDIFQMSQEGKNLETAATNGLICSLFWLPIVLGVRKFMSSFYKDIEY